MSLFEKALVVYFAVAILALAYRNPEITVVIVVIFAPVLGYRLKSIKRKEDQCREIFSEVFNNADCTPEYEQSFHHGYPCFTLTFQSKQQCEQYKSSNKSRVFAAKVTAVMEPSARKKRPFDADLGIYVTYKGEVADHL